ncbi:MAG: TIGR02266 family protein [Myxococcales bacterium]|nr:TIGR02266 family protein [Myxococcales bacterium]
MADDDRREHARYDTRLAVDYAVPVGSESTENFLFSYVENISEMGIFIRSDDPLAIGERLRLRFGPEGEEPLDLEGEVMWVNPLRPDGENLNPGMGVRFVSLTPEERERVVAIVRTVAYLSGDATN